MNTDIASLVSSGDEIRLLVGKEENPRYGGIGFEPEFTRVDQNVANVLPPLHEFDDPDEYWELNRSSVRFFNPVNNGFELKPGEIWKTRVTGVTILPETKLTKDGRRYVFVAVQVLGRKEKIEQEYDNLLKHWVTRVLSGNVTVGLIRQHADRVAREFRAKVPAQPARYYRQQQEVVLSVEEIKVGEKIVRQKITGAMMRETYKRIKEAEMEKIKHPFGKSIDTKTYRKLVASIPAYENLPALPVDIEVPENLIIY